ncbi:MAG TPA: hypothetical protein VKJ01_11510 [Candidatus Solibacter sp.]|nr:hypothetical protein [Candidatus Solibacter sp.]
MHNRKEIADMQIAVELGLLVNGQNPRLGPVRQLLHSAAVAFLKSNLTAGIPRPPETDHLAAPASAAPRIRAEMAKAKPK